MSRNDGTLTRQDLEELQARIDGLEERVKKLEGGVAGDALPLGHEFVRCSDISSCTMCHHMDGARQCGQPRFAHVPPVKKEKRVE